MKERMIYLFTRTEEHCFCPKKKNCYINFIKYAALNKTT